MRAAAPWAWVGSEAPRAIRCQPLGACLRPVGRLGRWIGASWADVRAFGAVGGHGRTGWRSAGAREAVRAQGGLRGFGLREASDEGRGEQVGDVSRTAVWRVVRADGAHLRAGGLGGPCYCDALRRGAGRPGPGHFHLGQPGVGGVVGTWARSRPRT